MTDTHDHSDPHKNEGKRAFWHDALPHIDMEIIRDTVRHALMPMYSSNVNHHGDVHLWVPPSIRKAKSTDAPGIPMRTDDEVDPLPHWEAEGKDKCALSFWVKQGSRQGSRSTFDAKLNNFVSMLSIACDIPPGKMEARYCEPPRYLTKDFDVPVDGAVVLAVPPEWAHKMPRVRKLIQQEYDQLKAKAEKIDRLKSDVPIGAATHGKFLDGLSWQQRLAPDIGAKEESHLPMDSQTRSILNELRDTALHDILKHKSELPLMPVPISGDKAMFSFSASQAERLGEPEVPLDLECDLEHAGTNKNVQGTYGLAIPLTRNFFTLSNDDAEIMYDGLLEQQIEAFTHAIGKRHPGMPLYFDFVRLENHLENLEKSRNAAASSAVVLMTDPQHQATLLNDIAKELMRDHHRLVERPNLRGGEDSDDRNSFRAPPR